MGGSSGSGNFRSEEQRPGARNLPQNEALRRDKLGLGLRIRV